MASLVALALCGCDGDGETPTPDANAGGSGGEGGMGGAGGTPADGGGGEADLGCLCPGAQTCDAAGDCVEPESCTAPEDCLAGRLCHEGACVDACLGDGDCGDGLRCDPEAGVCVDDDRCMSDADCPGGRCEQGACVAPCAADACPGLQTCDPGTGACIEPDVCADDIDCLDLRICLDGTCASPCAEDSECPGAQTCVEGECAEPATCTGDLDCTTDRLCVGGACQAPCGRVDCDGAQVCGGDGRCAEADPCGGDDGCFAGRRCDAGVCVEPCAEDAECAGVERCVEGRCVLPDACMLDAACGPGRICVEQQCVDACPARACPPDAMCDEATGRCVVQNACLEAADCAGAQRCVDGRCLEPAFCTGDLDCLGGRSCVDNTCVGLCDVDGDCPGRQRCAGGQCVEGAGCDADLDCLGARRCHPEIAVCVDACPDGACPAGLVCRAGLCGEPDGCLDDAECAGERVCRLGRCAVGECAAHDDCPGGTCADFACADAAPGACACPDGWACIAGACVQPGPCGGGTCPAGWVCRDDGLCGRCADDADCPGRCDDGICLDEIACESDDDCLPGHACLGGRCAIDFAGCVDDGLAHNGPDVAIALPPVALTGLVACEGVADWYRVGDAGAVRITVRAAADRPVPRVRLYAIDAAFDPELALAVAPAQPGEATLDAPPGDYLLSVEAAPGGGGPYGIDLRAVACADDSYERPWRNDRRADARRVAPGVIDGTLCVNDDDWFAVDVARRARISIEGAQATVGGQRAPLEVDGPAEVHVTGAVGARYRLVVEPIGDPAAACADAAPLPIGRATAAPVEGGADDFAPACRGASVGPDLAFAVEVPRAGMLSATLSAPEDGAELLLYRDCAAAPVACGTLGALDAAVEAATYYLVVDGRHRGDVEVTLDALSPLCLDPAPLAVGETPLMLPAGPADIGGACTDPDLGAIVRLVELDAPARARISLAGGGPEALLSIRGDCNGEPVACDVGAAPRLDTRLDAGTHAVIVQGAGAATVSLALEPVDDAPGFVDGCGAPFALGSGDALSLDGDLGGADDTVDLAACGALPGGADALAAFTLAAPTTVTAFIEQAAFGARLAIVDAGCAAVVECGSAMTGDVFAELPAGTYALVLEADGLGAGPFRVRLSAQ